MNLSIVSFNGTSLNDSSFEAYFPNPSVMSGPEGQPGFVERSYFGPVFTYKKRQPRTLPVHIKMKGTIASNVDTLKALFNPYADAEYKLLVADLNDSSKQYYIMATPISIPDVDGQVMIVNLWVADPIWKTETETSVTWTVTGTGDQESITVGGSFYSEPTFEITPTAAKSGGKAYRIFCPVYNPSTNTYTDYPVDIVNNALDTAALVADTTRSVVINDGDGITDADVTITYDGEVGTFPTSGLAHLGTEQISYTGKSATELTGCTRGVNGTAAAAHANDVVIYASKMEADGGDIQVTVDGVQVNYWLQDINNATTQIWCNLDLTATRDTTLGLLIADSGAITTITLENTTTNINRLYLMPNNGLVLIDSEMFSYTGKNMVTRQLIGVARSVCGTSAAEHTVGDNIHWIEHAIYIYHGDHDLASFTVDDAYKPYIELDSTNAEWTWDATFSQTNTSSKFILTRPAAWRARFPSDWDDTSDTYYNTYDRYYQNAYTTGYYESMDTTAPSAQTSESGVTFSVLGTYFVNTGYLLKSQSSAMGSEPGCLFTQAHFTHVAATGKKYLASNAGADWYRVDANNYMFRKANATDPNTLSGFFNFTDAFSVAAPSGTDASEAWSQAKLDLGGLYNYFLFGPTRGGSGLFDHECRIEVDTFTITWETTETPVSSCGTSAEYYHIDADLYNTTTGDYLSIDYNINPNTKLIINTANKTVIDNETGQNGRGAMTLSTYRYDWLSLAPGSNVMQWDETGATGLTIVVKRRERKL